MPLPEGGQVIRVILPSAVEVDAYYDRSTVPGYWRSVASDAPILPGTYAVSAMVTTTSGDTFVAYWEASTEKVFRADEGPDAQLSPAEVLTIATIDLRP